MINKIYLYDLNIVTIKLTVCIIVLIKTTETIGN